MTNTKRLGFLNALAASVALLLAAAAPASAAPVWRVHALANTTAAPGGTLTILVEARNVGTDAADGSVEPIGFNGALPAGLTLQSVKLGQGGGWDCLSVVVGSQTFTCQFFGTVDAVGTESYRRFAIEALVDSGASGIATTSLEMTGGGASPVSTVAATTITDAPPVFDIAAFDAEVTADAAGTPFTQAAGHPFEATTSIDFTTYRNSEPFKGDATPVEAVKDIEVDLPPGFFGDPTGVDRCTLPQLANTVLVAAMPLCSPSSQVGTTIVRSNGTLGGRLVFGPLPVFNMEPPVNAPARLGFNVAGTIVVLDVTVRTGGDYGLTARLRNISEGLAVAGSSLTLWGVPADPVHDRDRACSGTPAPWDGGPSCTSSAPRLAFLRNPTSCPTPGVGLPTTLRIDSWVDPGDRRERTIFSHLPLGYPFPPSDWGPPQGTSDCARVPFNPTIRVSPTTHAADSPTGLSVDLSLPQPNDPDTVGTSDLKKAVVTLPKGMTVNPSSAEGLGACSSAQIGLNNANDPTCPANSKIGEVEVETPALEDPLGGSVYLAKQGDNKFGSLLAIYIVAKGQGVLLKLPGRVSPQADGQLVTTFDDQPQAPFSSLRLEFYDGPRAPLRTPAACGTYTIQGEFSPWARPEGPVSRSDSFQITSGPNGSPCPSGQFNPRLSGGVESPIAGSQSPFSVKISRDDASQEISRVSLSAPQGLTAVLRGVPYCPDAALGAFPDPPLAGQAAAELANPSCPAASQVGRVIVGAGAGANPFYVKTGRAYLAGPYKGAPLSLAILTPALAGPFDLGNVMVRSAIEVNPVTAQITVRSDPLPTILHGIPLDVRDVRVNMDRPNFMLSPTSCDAMSIDGQLTSTQGATANPSQRFQMAECGALGFKPKLTLSLRGKTNRGAHPALTAVLKPRPGDANLARVSVALPKSEFLDQAHIRTICTRAQFAASSCPRGAIYGEATVTTPLFDQKLTGPVYLRSSNNLLPDLVPDLRGPADLPIRIESAGRVDEVNGGIRNTFDFIPDAPFTKLVLRLKGGNKGLLQNSRNICKQAFRATVQMDGQNGKVHDFKPVLRAGCGKKGKRGKRARR